MSAMLIRLISCLVGLGCGAWVLGIEVPIGAGIWCVVLLTMLYLIIRPLMQVIILPFNMFLLGLLSIATDALLVIWAAAWSPGLTITYAQGLLIAMLIGACSLALGHFKRQNLLKGYWQE